MSDQLSRVLLTIITSTYEAAADLEKSASHFIPQLSAQVEWLVIDGGSQDGTVEFLRSIETPQIRWISEPDQGIYDAWNKGLTLAQGEWICFVGAGDWAHDLSALLNAVSKCHATPDNPRLVYGRLELRNARGDALYELGSPWETIEPLMTQVMQLPHPCVLHHRSLFEEFGHFDASYRIAGDYEFLLRCHMRSRLSAQFHPSPPWVIMHLGGISTDPVHSLRQLQEVRRAQMQNGITRAGRHWQAAMLRVRLRLMLFRVLPERRARCLLDAGRKLMGKPPHWTVS